MSTEYEKLTKHFDKTFRKPGTTIDYLTGEQIVTRLNEELGWDGWAFEIVDHGYHLDSDAVWVKGRLTAGGKVKEQFGGQAHNRNKQGQIIDVGNDLKGAATDALKKCATLIGVGLYMAEKEGGIAAPSEPTAPPAQRKTFWEVTREMGYRDEDVTSLSKQMFDGKEPRALGTEQRKKLVLELEERKKKEVA